ASTSAAVGAGEGDETLLTVGVAPALRRRGLGHALLARLVAERSPGVAMTAAISVAERDVVDPLDVADRMTAASALLRGAGFDVLPVSPDVRRDDPWAIAARLGPR
ncbi:MAG TPA: hypothetical protein VFY23_09050, partial [Candidatus Limnocylindrales bacterium]|nr:hypothetical protein [Candidatus Limnocylindrales bacterium]